MKLFSLATRLTLLAGACALSGCAVVTVGAAAASLAVTAGSLAVDGAVGAARLTGKAAGAAVDAVLPSSDD